MNVLTFDIEEWAWAKAEGIGTAERYKEYDACLDRVLDVLDERAIKATFFCTGLMAVDFPQVVKLIQHRGHEIGCHSYRHTWMNKMTEAEAREDTYSAVDAIEQCIGQKVLSYRAPAFSICENNKWMFEILAGHGIERDSSIFHASRDVGGFKNFGCDTPCLVEYKGLLMKEFPVSSARLFGKEIAYSGGGYFRICPLSFVLKQMEKSSYALTYFHIADLILQKMDFMSKKDYEAYFKESGSLMNRSLRYLKNNFGKKSAYNKWNELVKTQDFVDLDRTDKMWDWQQIKTIAL